MSDNVKITVEERIDPKTGETVVVTRRVGRAVYTYYDEEKVADEYTTIDYGKQGTTHIFGKYPDDMTPEEYWSPEQPHIKRICQTAAQIRVRLS